jgi:hypothetical protein
VIVVALGLVQTGPYAPARTTFAAAGDCPVSATIVTSKLAAIIPVTRRRFPLNIALRLDKSTTNDFLMVTEDFQCQSPTVGN